MNPVAGMVPPWSRHDRRIATAIAVAAFAAYALLGCFCHPFAIGGAEMDRYVARAQELHHGGAAGAPCQPFGLPLLLLAGMWCGIEPFAGGRLVAAAGGAALVTATYGLLRLSVARPAALLAAAAVAATDLVVTNAQLASSDMPAAGAVAAALWCWACAARAPVPRLRSIVAAGLLMGIAIAMRYSSALALPAVLPLLVRGPWRRRAVALLGTGGALLVALAPHLWANARAYGSPFYQENWRNLVLKYQYDFDVHAAFLHHAEAPAQFAAHWAEWLWRGLGDAAVLFSRGLLAIYTSAAGTVAGVIGSLLLTAAMIRSLFGRDPALRVLAVAALAYGLMIAITFRPSGRFVLPLLPVFTAMVFAPLQARWPSGRVATVAGGLGLACALAAVPLNLAAFARSHGLAEAAAARSLAMQYDGLCNILMAVWLEDDTISAHLSYQGTPPDAATRTPTELWQFVQDTAVQRAIDFVVIGSQSAPVFVAKLLAVPPPAGYEVLRRDDVLAVRCPPSPPGWLRQAKVHESENGWQLELELTDDPRTEDMFAGYFFLRDPSGHWQPLDLMPAPGEPAQQRPRRYVRRMGAATSFPAGELTFVPGILLRSSGALLCGSPIRVTIHGGVDRRGTPR